MLGTGGWHETELDAIDQYYSLDLIKNFSLIKNFFLSTFA